MDNVAYSFHFIWVLYYHIQTATTKKVACGVLWCKLKIICDISVILSSINSSTMKIWKSNENPINSLMCVTRNMINICAIKGVPYGLTVIDHDIILRLGLELYKNKHLAIKLDLRPSKKILSTVIYCRQNWTVYFSFVFSRNFKRVLSFC